MIRVGQGFDVHAFGPGDHVILGGVRIPFRKGLQAHSDGDVLLHTVMDALLGAAGQRDIGHHFPPSEVAWKDADSRRLLRQVGGSLAASGWQLVNLDATIICQAPKVAPHREVMVANIARDLEADPEQVNIKATTTEGLGFAGRGEGIACQAVVLIQRNDS